MSKLISGYDFGKIIIDGKHYSNDVILLERKVIPNWWRNSGHKVVMDDLEEVLDFEPDFFIIGTGYNGRVKVSSDFISKLPFKTKVMATKEAVKEYNKKIEKDTEKVAAGFHLTC